MSFVVIAEVSIKANSTEAFLELITWQAEQSVAEEPGCLQFDVVRAQDDPSRFTFYEVYSDAAAFEAHRTQPRLATFMDKLRPMLAADPKITRLDRISANAK